jgi:hypothetical protein
MERDCSTPIRGVRVSSCFDQRRDHGRPQRRRGEVERRIACVQLVRNFLDQTLVDDACPRDLRRCSYELYRLGVVGDDSDEEL